MRVHIASYRSVEAAKRGWAELRQANEDLLGRLSARDCRDRSRAGPGDLLPGPGRPGRRHRRRKGAVRPAQVPRALLRADESDPPAQRSPSSFEKTPGGRQQGRHIGLRGVVRTDQPDGRADGRVFGPAVEPRALGFEPRDHRLRQGNEHLVALDHTLDAHPGALLPALRRGARSWRSRGAPDRATSRPPDRPRAGRIRSASSRPVAPRACGDRQAASASSVRNSTIASAAMAPPLVAPNESMSTPARQVTSAGAQSNAATALANRAPSIWTVMAWPWATAARAAIWSMA